MIPSTPQEATPLRRKKSVDKTSYSSQHPRNLYGGVFLQSILLSMLVLAVIFVNGWTDAPNSILTVVSTKTLSFRNAAIFAALSDFSGLLVTSLLCPSVAHTIFTIADFGTSSVAARIALQAALISIIFWSVLSWYFGIPTSESHALISGLTGASIALHGNLDGIHFDAWAKVFAGLFLSTICGLLVGRYSVHHFHLRKYSNLQIRRSQLLCSASMSFFHGAQDGQKFLALLLLVQALSQGNNTHTFYISFPQVILCATVMSAGVLCGGQRIIKAISKGMEGLNRRQQLIADLSGTACLFIATLLGLPVSTTHTKISSYLGASTINARSSGRKDFSLRIMLVWLATFPCCGLLSWLLTHLMLP